MGDMNKILLGGRLTKDTETKGNDPDKQFVTFSIAVNRDKKKGQEKADVDFFNCIMFNKYRLKFVQNLKKGASIWVSGQMQATKREKDGVKSTYWNVLVEDIGFNGPPPKSTSGDSKTTPENNTTYDTNDYDDYGM